MKKVIAVMLALCLCLGLTACKGSDYNKAVGLLESGDYTGAQELFEKVGDYKDAGAYAEALHSFASAIESLTAQNDELDAAASAAETLIHSGETALDESLRIDATNAMSNTKSVKVDVMDCPATVEEIQAAAQTMASADYTEVLNELVAKTAALNLSIKQFALVDNPSESYVISCLQKVPGVTGIEAATEDNDPNGKLGKAGGYTAAVFFSHENVNQADVLGDTIIDKGTEAGGQIEVYATVDDAERRNDYLTTFDGSFLNVGSHCVLGTCVLRTSDKMTASKQKQLEADMIEALTNVD